MFFEDDLLSDEVFIKRFCLQFHEYIALVLIPKQPYFWVRKVGMLRWLFRDQQVPYPIISN